MLTLKNIKSYLIVVMVILMMAGVSTISLEAGEPGVASKTFDFSLKDYEGKSHSLSDYKDSKAVVVIYVATRCPVSNAYNQRMTNLYKTFKDKGFAFLGINSNQMESVEEIKEHAQKNGLSFPILKDVDNTVADRYEASVTPEVYVLNKDHKILYHGRIDDSRREDQVTSSDLSNALIEILTGKEVTAKETKAFGCTIKRVKKG
jgi:peroxiredoxin